MRYCFSYLVMAILIDFYKLGVFIMFLLGLFIILLAFFFVVALLAFLYFLYKRGNLDFLKRNELPRETLEQQYTAGEISEEEYSSMKKNLLDK